MGTRVVWIAGMIGCVGGVLIAEPASAQEMQHVAYVQIPAPERQKQSLLEAKVSLNFQSVPLSAALQTIADQAALKIAFGGAVTRSKTVVTVTRDRISVRDGLTLVLRASGFTYRLDGEQILIEPVGMLAKEGTIVGKIVDAKTKQPIAGATLTIDGRPSVTSGPDGQFRILAPAGEWTMHVRALGHTQRTIKVVVVEGQTVSIDAALDPSASVLDEVIVTGTVVATERKAIPNPITVITAEEIERRGITRLEQLLRGGVPGVYVNDEGTRGYSAGPGVGANVKAQVYARGASNLGVGADGLGAPTPLKTYVDGVEILDPSYLGIIDPQSIEKIEIVTGPQAATVYGSGAMGGVMQIFTKKGRADNSPEVKLSLRYGMLESNISSARTPTHHDLLTLMGGSGPEFTYASTLSYTYTGEWQPALFAQSYGLSVGVSHTRGPLTANGSYSVTKAKNGLVDRSYGILGLARERTGEYAVSSSLASSPRESKNASQTAALNVDYRLMSWWQHHLTLGISQTDLGLVPQAAGLTTPSDTLFRLTTQDGRRMTAGYNSTIVIPSRGLLSGNFTAGMNGSSATQTYFSGCTTATSSMYYIGCSGATIYANKTIDETTYGGFGRVQMGLWEKLYLTFGLRGERNPNYGQNHKIDWTPNNGVAFTTEFKELTLKFLGSYGRATRAPGANWRDEIVYSNPATIPAQYTAQLGNPTLRPEYSRGPQGGVEIYYGNLGSLTVNHYSQRVTDLIQNVTVGFVQMHHIELGFDFGIGQSQYQNVAEVQQQGWELTNSLQVGPLSLRSVYSWADSRVRRVADAPGNFYWVGQSFTQIPTHTGSLTLGYAHGPTSVNLVANYRGTMITSNSAAGSARAEIGFASGLARLKQYVARANYRYAEYWQDGYTKADLTISHRLNTAATFMLNVMNLGNSFGSEGSYLLDPALGRNTTIGVVLRLPQR